MRPARQDPPVCCDFHLHRYMPKPDTQQEAEEIDVALARWQDEFWLLGDDGRETYDDLPGYVADLRTRRPVGLP